MKHVVLSLSMLKPGQSGIIDHVSDDTAVTIRLVELGLIPGEPIEVIKEAPLGDPVEIKIMDYYLCLRKQEAASIKIRIIKTDQV